MSGRGDDPTDDGAADDGAAERRGEGTDDADVVDARDLRYEYPDGTTGIRDVDLAIRRGERVGITGPNGSGKSTLLALLGGLVDPSRGCVEYFGETTDAEAVRERVGALMQDPDDYLFNATVREDIEYGPAQLDVPRAEAERRVDRLADELDLRGLLDKPPFRLSGGEKKRAALASVLSFDPDVLLLDEPVSNVDAAHAERILDLLGRLHREGTTLVTFTPDVELLPRIADRACVIDSEGRLAADGPVEEVLTDGELLASVGLAPPEIVRLFGELGWSNPPLDVEEAAALLDDLGVSAPE